MGSSMDSLDRILAEREAKERLENGFLPEELIENIITMMPFPSILKARTLSRAWSDKFLPIEFAERKYEKMRSSCRFQKVVSERSTKWEIFLAWIIKDEFWAFDQRLQRWERLLSLSFLPKGLLVDFNVQMTGVLLFFYPKIWMPCPFEKCLYVANILTRSCKNLLPYSNAETDNVLSASMVSDNSSQTYKVILLSEYDIDYDVNEGKLLTRVYDSQSHLWSDKIRFQYEANDLRSYTEGAYLNSVLYILNEDFGFIALKIGEGIVEFLDFPDEIMNRTATIDLLVCEGNLVAVARDYNHGEQPFLTYQVLKFDPESKTMWEVARGPPPPFNLGPPLDLGSRSTQPLSHGPSVFFGVEDVGGRMLTYNLQEDEWSCFSVPGVVSSCFNSSWKYKRNETGNSYWETQSRKSEAEIHRRSTELCLTAARAVSFQPGLNPFAAL